MLIRRDYNLTWKRWRKRTSWRDYCNSSPMSICKIVLQMSWLIIAREMVHSCITRVSLQSCRGSWRWYTLKSSHFGCMQSLWRPYYQQTSTHKLFILRHILSSLIESCTKLTISICNLLVKVFRCSVSNPSTHSLQILRMCQIRSVKFSSPR